MGIHLNNGDSLKPALLIPLSYPAMLYDFLSLFSIPDHTDCCYACSRLQFLSRYMLLFTALRGVCDERLECHADIRIHVREVMKMKLYHMEFLIRLLLVEWLTGSQPLYQK